MFLAPLDGLRLVCEPDVHDWNDLPEEQQESIDALRVNAWESAFCTACSARFTTEQEAVLHESVHGHSVIYLTVLKAVN
jgi:hypothetical protein